MPFCTRYAPPNKPLPEPLLDDLEMDEVDRYIVADELEDEFQISLTERECGAWKTVSDIIDLGVRNRLEPER